MNDILIFTKIAAIPVDYVANKVKNKCNEKIQKIKDKIKNKNEIINDMEEIFSINLEPEELDFSDIINKEDFEKELLKYSNL